MTIRLHFGESRRPEPLEYQFLDADGVPLTFGAGWTGRMELWSGDVAVATVVTAGVSTPDTSGRVTVDPWPSAMFVEGRHRFILVAEHSGTGREYASDVFVVVVTKDGP